MKRGFAFFAVMLVALLVMSMSFSVLAKGLTIGVSLPTQSNERWVRDRQAMEKVADEMDLDLRLQIANQDAGKQISQCQNLITQGIDVLVLAPYDATSAATIVESAHQAGIKVISYDRLITNTFVDTYISFDNVRVGELQGEYITSVVSEGNYVVLSGAATDNNAKLFKQGAMKYIQPLADKGDINIVMEQSVKNWDPSNALKLMENALTANDNNIDAVLAPNDQSAGACVQALAAQGMAGDVPITGQDATLPGAQRIVEGTQTMTIFKDTRELARKSIEVAMAFAEGKDISTMFNGAVWNKEMYVPSILLEPIVVDKDNLDEVLIESGYLNKEDVYN